MPELLESKEHSDRGPARRLWSWLTNPLILSANACAYRVHLLAWLLLAILLLLTVAFFAILLASPMSNPLKNEYAFWILGLDVCVGLAYCLNCAGYYPFAAGLTVMAAFVGPWGTLLIDPTFIRGDFVPLAYTILSVILSSILLSPLATAVLAMTQIIVLALIPLYGPSKDTISWPGFLGLVLFASVLSIISNGVRQRYVDLIERQALIMAKSEAQLRELSIRDHLTQLFNRRYLEEVLDFEIQRSLISHEFDWGHHFRPG